MTPTCVVSTDKPRRRWWVLGRTMASLMLVASGTAAAALLGLVAEDLLPTTSDWPVWSPHAARLFLLGVSLGAAVWATWSLSSRRKRTGTLYYLRLQDETNEDWHRSAVLKATKEYLAFRSISAWCDPGAGTVDVRSKVAQMSEEFQRATNDDADDSGYDAAPNLIFPVALAMGYDWIPPKVTRLREFNRTKPGTDIQEFQWRLTCASASGKECKDADQLWHPPHFRADDDGSYRLVANTWPTRDPSKVSSVWLEFWLSNTDWSDPKREMKSRHKDAAEVRREVFVEGPEKPHSVPRDYHLLKYGAKGSPRSGLSVLQIAEGAAYWLGKTLEDFPKATVFVAGGMPKTVALAMGHLMTQPPMRRGAAHPWRRIVPMGHFHVDPEPELRPMWVRSDQVDPDRLIAAIPPNPVVAGPRPSAAQPPNQRGRGGVPS